MTELQREFELANRAEKRNAEMMRQKLLSKVRMNHVAGSFIFTCVWQSVLGSWCMGMAGAMPTAGCWLSCACSCGRLSRVCGKAG